MRLETYSEEGSSEGAEQVGQPLTRQIQAQTTYARLIKHDDDEGFSIKVLKQKIWVNGMTYELQVL